MRIRFLLLLLVMCGCEPADEGDRSAATDTAVAGDVADTAGGDTSWPPSPALPSFEDYPMDERFEGTPVAVDLSSAEYGPRFETRLREGAAAGPDFAGRAKRPGSPRVGRPLLLGSVGVDGERVR